MTTKQPKPKLPKFEDNYSEAAYFAGITQTQAIQCDLALRDLCAGIPLPWHNSHNPLVNAVPAKQSEVQGTCSRDTTPHPECLQGDWKPSAVPVALGTCADRPTKPHIEGSHSACDMFQPVAAPEKRCAAHIHGKQCRATKYLMRFLVSPVQWTHAAYLLPIGTKRGTLPTTLSTQKRNRGIQMTTPTEPRKELVMTVRLSLPNEYSDGGVKEILSALVTTGVLRGWELVDMKLQRERPKMTTPSDPRKCRFDGAPIRLIDGEWFHYPNFAGDTFHRPEPAASRLPVAPEPETPNKPHPVVEPCPNCGLYPCSENCKYYEKEFDAPVVAEGEGEPCNARAPHGMDFSCTLPKNHGGWHKVWFTRGGGIDWKESEFKPNPPGCVTTAEEPCDFCEMVQRHVERVHGAAPKEGGSQPIDHDDFCEHGISFEQVCPHCSAPFPKQDEQVELPELAQPFRFEGANVGRVVWEADYLKLRDAAESVAMKLSAERKLIEELREEVQGRKDQISDLHEIIEAERKRVDEAVAMAKQFTVVTHGGGPEYYFKTHVDSMLAKLKAAKEGRP